MAKRLSQQQIEDANSVHILDYLQLQEGYTLKKLSAAEYCLVEHDSFRINESGAWQWFSQSLGGMGTVGYLMKVKNMDYISAVKHLTASSPSERATQKSTIPRKIARAPTQQRQFRLPDSATTNQLVLDYLQSRGISRFLIQQCINEKKIYQDTQGNCVFVGYDGDVPKYAAKRSTLGNFQGDKKDVSGSDKAYGFKLSNGKTNQVFVFESPIDVLSHAEIYSHLNDPVARLSLGGTASRALFQYLTDNPSITQVHLCLDNDEAGKSATEKITQELQSNQAYAHVSVRIGNVPIGVDYNDTLWALANLSKSDQTTNEHEREAQRKRKSITR